MRPPMARRKIATKKEEVKGPKMQPRNFTATKTSIAKDEGDRFLNKSPHFYLAEIPHGTMKVDAHPTT